MLLTFKIDHAGGLLRDLCDLVVGFTSTCLAASRFAPDHGVLQRGDCRNLGLSDLQARLHKEDRKPLLRLDVGLIILSTNINMKKYLKTGRVLFLSASSVFWTIAILERIWLSMPDNQLLKRLQIFSLHDHYTQKFNFNFIVFWPSCSGCGCGASRRMGW